MPATRPTTSALLALALAGWLLASCGNQSFPEGVSDASSACNTGTAQIGVSDNALTALCGCTEGDQIRDPAPANLTCTVPAGTTVFFIYIGTQLQHQILSTGTTTFPSSPPNLTRRNRWGVPAHGVVLENAGTYTFRDVFMPSLQGSIVVTP